MFDKNEMHVDLPVSGMCHEFRTPFSEISCGMFYTLKRVNVNNMSFFYVAEREVRFSPTHKNLLHYAFNFKVSQTNSEFVRGSMEPCPLDLFMPVLIFFPSSEIIAISILH